MKVGLFGGTFDPPHIGHLIVAHDAMHALRLDRIVFVPAASPPHKPAAEVTSAEHRVRMLELAVAGNVRFGIDRIELDRPGPSYTVDTLKALHARDAGVEWTLLVGADQFDEFATWRSPDEIRRLARIAVLSRAGTTGTATTAGVSPADRQVDVTRIDISSTALRERVASGRPVRYLVPDDVASYMIEHRLYSRNGTSATG